KILDFGLAKLSRDSNITTDSGIAEESLTGVGLLPGTAVDMSPEQARGEELDPRSDTVSFGICLYDMATGRKRFSGTNTVTTLHTYLLVATSCLLITVLAAVGTWWFQHRGSAFGANKKSIAVLPLQNLNADPSVDYLRFALADEIANVLTNSRALDVRPSAITRKYNGADLDPQQIGRELHVGNILTGHFVRQEKQLLVTLEAVE